jgi:pilus assembly protein CpaB
VIARISLGLRWLLMRRRPVSAALATFSVIVGASTVASHHEPTAQVVVAARDIHAGHTLTAADLRVTSLAAQHIPDTVVSSPEEILGRVVTGAITAREVITTGRVLSPRTAKGMAVPVRLADAGLASLLRPGDVIDVLASDSRSFGSPATIIAERLRVIAVPHASSTTAGHGALIVVGADSRRAALLAGAAEATLTAVIHPD